MQLQSYILSETHSVSFVIIIIIIVLWIQCLQFQIQINSIAMKTSYK